jgi:hypothetical protein
MARVNIEDDLWTSGRLWKLAKAAKLDEDTALGRLVNVYRLTQAAGLVSDTQARVGTVIVIAFANDADADAFLTAMISAQLAAVLENGHIHIRGNEQHVARLTKLREMAANGGKKRQQEKPNDFGSRGLAAGKPGLSRMEPEPSPHGALLTPSSLLPSLASNEAREIHAPALGNPKMEQPPAQELPSGDRLSDYTALQIPPAFAARAYKAYAEEVSTFRKLPMPLIPPPADLAHFKRIVAMAGNVENAEIIARAWPHCEDPKGYFRQQGWAPWLLAEERNFTQARAMAARLMSKNQPSA